MWPWICVAATLSFEVASATGHSACVLPWQSWQASPACPVESRYCLPGFSANRDEEALIGEAARSPTRHACLRRIPSAASTRSPPDRRDTASPVWHDWQRGTSVQGRREAPSAAPSRLPPVRSAVTPPTAFMSP